MRDFTKINADSIESKSDSTAFSDSNKTNAVIARFCVAESWQSKIYNKTKWIASASPRNDERRESVIARLDEIKSWRALHQQLIYTCTSA